jgi:protein TonB
MTVTLFLAALFHLIVILGVSFAPPITVSGSVPTLEVLLVNSALPESLQNDSADYLAERTQQGSGNSPDGRTRRPVAGSVAAVHSGAPDGGDALPAHESETAAEAELLTGPGGERIYAAAATGRQTPPAALPLEAFAGSSSPFSGSSTDVEFQLKGAPRRELLVTPNTRISDVAIYLDAWKRRIEQLGTINFPNAARRSRLSGNPVIEVVLASSGGLVRADVRRSSGHGELDRAALDILKLATPFEAFPEDLAARYEVLRFAYEWRFVGGRLTGSSVEVPAQ